MTEKVNAIEKMTEKLNAIAKIAASVQKISSKIETQTKDETATVQMKSGGKYTYSYMNLATLEKVLHPLLAEEEIISVVLPVYEDGQSFFVHRVYDKDSNFIEYARLLFTPPSDPQNFGAMYTYYRRYLQCGTFSVATEDNDGEMKPDKPRISLSKFHELSEKYALLASVPVKELEQSFVKSKNKEFSDWTQGDVTAAERTLQTKIEKKEAEINAQQDYANDEIPF